MVKEKNDVSTTGSQAILETSGRLYSDFARTCDKLEEAKLAGDVKAIGELQAQKDGLRSALKQLRGIELPRAVAVEIQAELQNLPAEIRRLESEALAMEEATLNRLQGILPDALEDIFSLGAKLTEGGALVLPDQLTSLLKPARDRGFQKWIERGAPAGGF